MFKAIRIGVLLCILVFVALSTWLTQARTTDWDAAVWVQIYPINADGDPATDRYIDTLSESSFAAIESFLARETERYGVVIEQPVKLRLGPTITEQPPALGDAPNVLDVMMWSLRMRWWVGSVTDGLEDIEPDVRIFVRYHQPDDYAVLGESVGVRKGMFGIVNAYSGRPNQARNNVVIAHEFLHTVGASDKYDPATNQPLAPAGLGEPERSPLYPQRLTEIMGGRVALSPTRAEMPDSLRTVVIGPQTAAEIGLTD